MSMPHLVLAVVVAVSFALVAYAYIGYPVVIWALSRLFGRDRRRPDVDDAQLPTVSLLIAAYNEESEIAGRIENALEMDYPADKLEIVVASDGSSDRTNEIVRRFARFGVKLLAFPVRRGKANVLNDAVPGLAGDIVMLSDANTRMHATAVQRLAAWFDDRAIGVVCGRLVLTDPRTGRNVDGLYWKYETFLKKCEGRLGALLGSNGGIYAIRKALFQGIPPTTILDDFLIPLLALQRGGGQIIYDREAVAVEETPAEISSEFHRRARIGAGGFQSISWLAGLLNPRHGWVSFAFLSHKILRWLCPFALIVALAANALLVEYPAFLAMFVLQVLFYAVSLGAGRLPSGPRLLRYPRLGTMFTMMNAALLVGFFRWARGIRSATWKRTDRAVETPATPLVASGPAGTDALSDLPAPSRL
ncbi:MAG: glycosyltransferase family 2 protein [Gemmataceae bacterium]